MTEELQRQAKENENSERAAFDKGIMLLNTGAFGASFLLLNAVSDTIVIGSKPYLFYAWCAFTFSALSTVVSHYASAASFKLDWAAIGKQRMLESLRRAMGKASPSIPNRFWSWVDNGFHNSQQEFLIFVIPWFNRISLILFIIGAGLLLWFANVNLEELKPKP